MRLKSVAAATVLTAATVLPTALTFALAPSAVANNSGGRLVASVSPTTVAPGGRVGLNVEGCGTRTGTARSSAFGTVNLAPGNLEATNLFGSATVHRNASPGTHTVTFQCDGLGGRTTTVSLHVTPGAARGGLGGSMGQVSPGEIAIGGALVAGALGAGVWYLRRRTEAGT
ncbi:hypothetical protein ACIQUQ_06130 [Streptomyces sp. NPDC101118]|uniref:hypothetical protein n=1 Tax=Streptomyces sp. NPDC101118 TaxID=3366109 RepID=UPI003815CF92